MSKSTTDELVKAISTKKKKQTNKTEAIKKWLTRELWDGRPTQWLAVGLTCWTVAYTTWRFTSYYVPASFVQVAGVISFVITLAILSRSKLLK